MVDRIRHIMENSTVSWWGAIAPGEDTTSLMVLTFANHLKHCGLFDSRVPLSTRVAKFKGKANAHTHALFDHLPNILKTLDQINFYNLQPDDWRNYECSGMTINNQTVLANPSNTQSLPFEWVVTYNHPPIYKGSTLKDIVW